jgi:hypothetical protein
MSNPSYGGKKITKLKINFKNEELKPVKKGA